MALTDATGQGTRSTVLETPGCRVTTWLPADLPDLRALHADERTMRYMRSGVEDEARVRGRLATYLAEQAERGWTKWRVADAQGRFVGRAGFGLFDGRSRRELGYVLAPSVWGRGLATELARALVTWHVEHPDPRVSAELAAFAFTDNTASRRVLEKAGFACVGERVDGGIPVALYHWAPAA